MEKKNKTSELAKEIMSALVPPPVINMRERSAAIVRKHFGLSKKSIAAINEILALPIFPNKKHYGAG